MELAKKFKIKNNPSFLIFGLNGRVDKKYVGSDSIDKVINRTQELIDKNTTIFGNDNIITIYDKSYDISKKKTKHAIYSNKNI